MTSIIKVDNIQNSSGTDAVSISSNGDVGVGTAPNSWGSTYEALSVGPWSSLGTFANADGGFVSGNAYNDGTNWKYRSNGTAENYKFLYGSHIFENAASGTAGSNITFQERMRIDGSGNLLIGRSSTISFGANTSNGIVLKPDRLDVSSASVARITQTRNSTGTLDRFYSGASVVGSITTNGSSTSYNTSSDYRLKENSVDLTGAITRVKSLQPKRFNFISDTTDTLVDGFMAHEAQSVVPEAVSGTHNEVDADGNPVYQGIDQSKLVPLLTAALQEAIAKIETLETKVTALENA